MSTRELKDELYLLTHAIYMTELSPANFNFIVQMMLYKGSNKPGCSGGSKCSWHMELMWAQSALAPSGHELAGEEGGGSQGKVA